MTEKEIILKIISFNSDSEITQQEISIFKKWKCIQALKGKSEKNLKFSPEDLKIDNHMKNKNQPYK